MLFKFIVANCFICPLIGIWLMEEGVFGGSINRTGHPNGATWAFMFYIFVALLTMKAASGGRFFWNVGRAQQFEPVNPEVINRRVLVLMFLMLMFELFGIGGIENYRLTTNAGHFRASLGDFGGVVGGIILKYIAPAMYAFVLLTNVAWDRRRLWSPAVVFSTLMMCLIGGSYGYKSAFVLALLPAAILYFWQSSMLMLLPLGVGATVMILSGYLYYTSVSGIGVAFEKMIDRLFVLQGDVSWLVWDTYQKGLPLPDYYNTVLPILGDRIASFFTGVTIENRADWVASHFSLMITNFSGYSVDFILGGHNNTATVFSEGILAGGLFGVVVFAILVGLLVNLTYNFIINKLRARDFAWAAVGTSYFVYAVMPWLLSGGIQVAIHISIPVLLYGTYFILYKIKGPSVVQRKQIVEAS